LEFFSEDLVLFDRADGVRDFYCENGDELLPLSHFRDLVILPLLSLYYWLTDVETSPRPLMEILCKLCEHLVALKVSGAALRLHSLYLDTYGNGSRVAVNY
jgi:uncharacterized membrane protein